MTTSTKRIKPGRIDKNRIVKKRNFKMTTLKILSYLLPLIIAYILFRLSASKKDVEAINSNMDHGFSQLQQDYLNNNDYKKYLEIYEALYKEILEKSFPGGYTTFGLRDNSAFMPKNINSVNVISDVDGKVSFQGNNCTVIIGVNDIYYVKTKNHISSLSLEFDIENYEIGKLYRSNLSITTVKWKPYIQILSDNRSNPVFVFGFAE